MKISLSNRIQKVKPSSTLAVAAKAAELKAQGKKIGEEIPLIDQFNNYPKLAVEALERQPGANLASAKGTWWGALNAVTYVEDHLRESQQEGNALHSAWFGAAANRKAKALDLAVEYAKVA